MDWQQLLLSFNGRQRRLHFWLVGLGIIIVNSIISNLLVTPAYIKMAAGQPGAFGPAAIVGCLISLLLLWPYLANGVKRCHDRDKSGWWLVAYALASLTVIGLLWPIIDLGFIDGTPGPNKFGPSPKGVGGPAPAV